MLSAKAMEVFHFSGYRASNKAYLPMQKAAALKSIFSLRIIRIGSSIFCLLSSVKFLISIL